MITHDEITMSMYIMSWRIMHIHCYTVVAVVAASDDDVLSFVRTLTARLMYRHIWTSEVFVDFDKEDLVHSTCSRGV